MTSLKEMPQLDLAGRRYQRQHIAHWDCVGEQFQPHSRVGRCYQDQLQHYYRLLVPTGVRVLELGCGNGDLLAALEP